MQSLLIGLIIDPHASYDIVSNNL